MQSMSANLNETTTNLQNAETWVNIRRNNDLRVQIAGLIPG